MNAADFTVTIEWATGPHGEYCEAIARTNHKAKRTIAVARLDVSITAEDFLTAYGSEGRKMIEESVRQTCYNSALLFPG